MHQDLFHQYYSIGDSISEQLPEFHYHKGLGETDEGEEGRKETIEEVFRSWHEENELEAGVHLEFELEHGRSGKSDGSGATPGNEDAQVEEIGFGQSEGDVSNHRDGEESDEIEVRESKEKQGSCLEKNI